MSSAALAPMPTKTRDAVSAFASDVCDNAYLNMENWKNTVAKTRSAAASITGGGVEEIAFIKNTSDGVSIVAEGLKWREGDEVIIGDIEFPSNVYPWLNLKRKGVTVRVVKSRDGRVTPDMIAEAVTGKTRIVAISSVQYITGYRADLAALGQMARDKGFLLCVDAIQSLGALPMDVKSFGIDFLACGGHKWLCAPEGIGIFYCAKERMELLDVTRAGWHTVKDCYNFGHIDFTLQPTAERFEEGTPNMMGIHGLKESLATVTMMGVERNEEHILALNRLLGERLTAKGFNVLSPIGRGERSNILIFTAKDPRDNGALVKKLHAAKIMVMERGAGIRVAPHFFNTAEEIEKLMEIL
ncbi:MAG: aminotransferase class V-fold PLP-dependent enzyme [Nitrospinae bacterium]|nr:aminotransferase class V-fold PLP-dependent enzyme [Nitrospinota bacterium]